MKLKEIAAALDGALVGDGEMTVDRPAHPAEAGPSDLALAIDPATVKLLATTKARVALVAAGADVPPAIVAHVSVRPGRYALAALTRLFDRPPLPASGIHPTAVVETGASLGRDVAVGALAWIGADARIGERTVIMPQASVGAGARLGADCVVHSGVRIGPGVVIGARVILHPNAVIGADGFSFATPEPGSIDTARATGKVSAANVGIAKIHSLGTVILGDDVEIGANSTIDRATIAATRVGRGTKIDNLVMVAHNSTIGENCLIAGQVGISGSVSIGDRVVLAGQAGIADHVRVGNDSIVMAAAAVGRDVPARSMVCGLPAVPRDRFLEQVLNVARLRSLVATVSDLKTRVAAIERTESARPGA
ncbi:MAG: UDP-3-O-(3-hydroxymyristoyl)glucosamine N-acyltransferase [Alphaproteobacteria bacterium]|nr:UDP-3-O-(3-hydroxymyristoyl)glucosamine N-acyltransferase [Alphaproteobacteria bacterium]